MPRTLHACSFQRALSSVPDIFRFLDEALGGHRLSPGDRGDVYLAVEELFTNMVRHQPRGGDTIGIFLEQNGSRLVIRLVDTGVERFDPATAPEPDLGAAPEERRPGGLGIFLARRLMTGIRYYYDECRRTSTVTLEKILEVVHVQPDVGREGNDSPFGDGRQLSR